MTVEDCRFVFFPRVRSSAGNLTIIEHAKEINFLPRRVYYITDVPDGENRGAHAHKTLWQLLVCLNGSFELVLDDGTNKRMIHMSNAGQEPYGILIVPGIWRDLVDFRDNAVCMVLASEYYDATDYIRDYNDYLKFKEHAI